MAAAHAILVAIGAGLRQSRGNRRIHAGTVVGMDRLQQRLDAQSGQVRPRCHAECAGKAFIGGKAIVRNVPDPGAQDRPGR
jgi:hypothetical protein